MRLLHGHRTRRRPEGLHPRVAQDIKQHTGLALTVNKQGTPAGPGGSSSCGLSGKPLQTVDVQFWRGSSAASFFQPAMYKAKEYAGPGYSPANPNV